VKIEKRDNLYLFKKLFWQSSKLEFGKESKLEFGKESKLEFGKESKLEFGRSPNLSLAGVSLAVPLNPSNQRGECSDNSKKRM